MQNTAATTRKPHRKQQRIPTARVNPPPYAATGKVSGLRGGAGTLAQPASFHWGENRERIPLPSPHFTPRNASKTAVSLYARWNRMISRLLLLLLFPPSKSPPPPPPPPPRKGKRVNCDVYPTQPCHCLSLRTVQYVLLYTYIPTRSESSSGKVKGRQIGCVEGRLIGKPGYVVYYHPRETKPSVSKRASRDRGLAFAAVPTTQSTVSVALAGVRGSAGLPVPLLRQEEGEENTPPSSGGLSCLRRSLPFN